MNRLKRPLRMGLTGGIGSGKSTVAKVWVAQGAVLLDADAIAKQVTQPNGAALPALIKRWGHDLLDEAGGMNRDHMRSLIFHDPDAKKDLEAIIHPLVLQAMEAGYEAAWHQQTPVVVFDIPLLAESVHWTARLDRITVVDCSPTTQIQRVMQRNQWSKATITAVMQQQATRIQRLQIADFIINNEAISLNELVCNSKIIFNKIIYQ